jgi:hypothetical protein
MDAALAGVLGAVAGAASTIAVAAITSVASRRQQRIQRDIDHERWRRETRRDTYAAFLAGLAAARAPLDEALSEIRKHDATLDALEPLLRRAEDLAGKNEEATYTVMLEGPSEVSEAANLTMDGVRALIGLLREYADRSRDGRDTRETEHLIDEVGEAFGVAPAAFLARARKAIETTEETDA